MTANEIRIQLLDDEAFVFSEFERLQFLFKLKQEIRYGESRDDSSGADSVAEHVYGMHILFHYFWPLEDPAHTWDKATILSMITLHDIDEIITGDIIGYLKTSTQQSEELTAQTEVLARSPSIFREQTEALLQAYAERQSSEAKFAKALDKIETVFQVYSEPGKALLNRMGTTRSQHDSIKIPYLKDFPVIMRFYKVITAEMERKGFFTNTP